jgi:uncharacterized protein
MNTSLVSKLCCPIDKHDLTIKIFKQEKDEITEALLTCRKCGRYYPVIYGIPVMTPDEYREKALEEPILKRWGLQLEKKENGKLLIES